MFLSEWSVSINEFATKSGLSHQAIRNIIDGTQPKEETRQKIEYAMRLISQSISVFGEWLKESRVAGKISVSDVSKASGISIVAIYNIESGKTQNPSEKTQKLISRAIESILKKNVEAPNTKKSIESSHDNLVGDFQEFDPHSPDSHPEVAGIYVFYDVSDRPIYVGQSSDIKKRIKGHEEKFWFKRPIVQAGSFVEIKDEIIRSRIEKILIKFLKSNAVINKIHVDREVE